MLTRKISNAFDSHVHWAATGGFLNRLNLAKVERPDRLPCAVVDPTHFRGEWLLGFGWDQTGWPAEFSVHRSHLDQAFPGVPVKFTRVDGHAAWVSTEALKRAGLFYQNPPDPDGGVIVKDPEGWPTGLLIELAVQSVDRLIPEPSAQEVKRHLVMGARLFNKSGFTHIRDMSCDATQWQAACELADAGQLTLAVEQLFGISHPDDFHRALDLCVHARKSHPVQLRPMGVKVYYDGSLGSESAYLSRPYRTSPKNRGVVLLERIALKEMMAATWSRGLHFAVHAIGDEAAHQVACVANELWQVGEEGVLQIEHAQMLRPETIQMLREKPVICYMQPCHWLSDKRWLREKLDEQSYSYLFPWRALEEAGILFFFGSDSPIEAASLMNNWAALQDSAAAGIPTLRGEFFRCHSHPDRRWVPGCATTYEDGQVREVQFMGRDLLAEIPQH